MKSRIYTFDFFRVIGAFLIFLCHVTLFDTHIGGGLAVEMFFVLSGFVMMMGYGTESCGFVEFMRKRFKRLYPDYFITLILGLLYMVFVLGFDFWRSLLKIPVYMCCAQTLTPFISATGFNSPGWYVATLIWIYIGFFVFEKLPGIKWLLLCVCAVVLVWVKPLVNDSGYGTWLYYFSPFSRFVDFSIGMLAAIIYKKYPLNINSKFLMTCVELISLGGGMLCIVYESEFQVNFYMGILLGMVFYVFSQQKGYISDIMRFKVFANLSKYTYSFFLIHYLVIMTITKTMHLNPGFTFSNVLLVIGMFVISAILSVLLHNITSKKLYFAVLKQNIN